MGISLGLYWTRVHSRPKPSKQASFYYFTNLSDVGFATPEAAFQTYHEAIHNQTGHPIDTARTKELWNLPDDFDDPKAGYVIDIGQGVGREIGYRVVSRERIASNEVRLTIDYERRNGTSFRREKVLIDKEGHWRVQPVKVTPGKATAGR